MTTQNPLPIRLAQTLGITTNLITAGCSLSLSTFVLPRIMESPPQLCLKQWNGMYQTGKLTLPPLGIVSSIFYFYLAYKAHLPPSLGRGLEVLGGFGGRTKMWLYVTSGVLSAGVVPYALVVLLGTNRELLGRVERVEGKGKGILVERREEESIHQLVDRWGVLNLGRSLMLAVAGVLGVWTSLN